MADPDADGYDGMLCDRISKVSYGSDDIVVFRSGLCDDHDVVYFQGALSGGRYPYGMADLCGTVGI